MPPTDDESTVSTDPGSYTVAGIKEYIEANPDEADATLEAERGRHDARTTLVEWLDNFITRRDAGDGPEAAVEGAEDGDEDEAEATAGVEGISSEPVGPGGVPFNEQATIGGSVITSNG